MLERAAKLSAARGGGSLTALPIAETDAGNLTAYIPTNLISITDGQIVLDARLFHEGRKPAVDVGLEVSRVGGKTQAPRAARRRRRRLRLDYAQFLELEIFTRFGGMSDMRVRGQLTRGARIRADRSTSRGTRRCGSPTRWRWSSPCSRACSIRCRWRRWRRSATACPPRSTAARRRSSTRIETTGNCRRGAQATLRRDPAEPRRRGPRGEGA